MKKSTSLVLSAFTAAFLVGCGGGESSSTTTNTSAYGTSLNVTVERGATYDAIVTDADGQIATQVNGQNIYTFNTKPKLPISVNGGWIDVDGDGELTTNDMELNIEMKSYTSVVTPLTTFIADEDELTRNSKLQELIQITGVSEENLLKVASESNTNGILAINAIYQEMINNNTNNPSISNILTTLSSLQNNVNLTGLTDSKDIAQAVESKTIDNLLGGSKISKISYNEMDELQKLIIFGEKWKVRKVDSRYEGNRVYIENDKLICDAKFKDGNNIDLTDGTGYDSRAEIRTKLKEKKATFTSIIKANSFSDSIGKMQVNAYLGNGDSGTFLTGINIKYNRIDVWVQDEISFYPNYQAIDLSSLLDSTRIADAETNTTFVGDEFQCTINIDENGFTYDVVNLTKNITYPTKTFNLKNASSSDINISESLTKWNNLTDYRFDQLMIRTKVDNRAHIKDGSTNLPNTILEIKDISF